MVKWHPILVIVTAVAEHFSIVAANAVGFFSLGVKTMSEFVVEIVSPPGLVVAPMAVYAVDFLLMAGLAPIRFKRGLFGVLVPPADRVNIRKCNLPGVTELTVPGGVKAVMTVHTQRFGRHERHFAFSVRRAVTCRTAGFEIQVQLVIELH